MLAHGYRENSPVECPPSGGDTRIWTITLDYITIERWDAEAASWNGVVGDHSEFTVDDYTPEIGLELLSCPSCRSTHGLEATGHWGGPLTFTCPEGHATVVEARDNPGLDWGTNLLARLILTEADPASWARTLTRRLTEWRDAEHDRRRRPWYTGPDKHVARIAEKTDLTTADLAQALHTAIGILLPRRHAGRPLELLLVQAALALTTPAIRDTDDGHALDRAIRTLLDDIHTEWKHTAPTRVLVREQLHAWRDEGGPELWQASWDQTLQLAEVSLGGYVMGQEGLYAEAAAALTTAFYIVSATNGITPAEVTAQQVVELAALHHDPSEVPALWEELLRDLGHESEDSTDPVARLWRRMRIDHTPAGRPSHPLDVPRSGPAVTDGIRTAVKLNRHFFRHHSEVG